jgi:hypothetical protein
MDGHACGESLDEILQDVDYPEEPSDRLAPTDGRLGDWF